MGFTQVFFFCAGLLPFSKVVNNPGMHELMAFMFLLHLITIVSDGVSTLKVSENNGNSVFVEMLRGRDGLPGRNGPQGPAGPPGPIGPPGPRRGGAIYTRWGKSSCPHVAGTELVYYWREST